jgi:transcriptional regulator with XRE-family HTH domain
MATMEIMIAKRLAELRGNASYRDAAKMTGVSATMLWRLEKRQVDPTLAIMIKIAKAYGVTVAYLIGEMEAA